jgi:hypothetical protein
MLTPERARALGIDVFEQNGTEVTSPYDAPTADIHADRFVSYTLLQSRCSGFFQPDMAVTECRESKHIRTSEVPTKVRS